MAGDIDEITRRIASAYPQVQVEPLRVSHPADDAGLWFFRVGGVEVQLESSAGNCPFLLESSAHPRRRKVRSVGEAVAAIAEELRLPKPEFP
jgi:hypothetical protein